MLNDLEDSFISIRTIEIKALIHRTNRNLLEIGQKLIEVKQHLGHGNFGAWLKSEFDWSQDTAERCMNVAKNLPHIPTGAEFESNALYLLASPSTSREAREEALSIAESGEKITHTLAKSIVEWHKQDDVDLERLEAIATPPSLNQMLVVDEQVSPKSDSVPFHCLMNQQQRERLFDAINQAKTNYELKTTAEALDVIAQEYLNV